MARRLSLLRARPSKNTSPAVGLIRPRISRPSVDLPEPDSPTSPSVSPALISRSTPSTALTVSLRPKSVRVLPAGNSLRSPSVLTNGALTCEASSFTFSSDPDTGDIVIRRFSFKGRSDLGAPVDRDRASRMESAPRWRIEQAGHSARNRSQAPTDRGLQTWYRVK